MIQRKQTVFIVLALISTLVCLSLPIGTLVPADRSGVALANDDVVYNLCIISGVDGAWNFKTAPLFFVLLLTCPIGTYAIFKYNNRKAQARLCLFNVLLTIGWYIVFFVFTQLLNGKFDIAPTVALPLGVIILYLLAKKGIADDEKLIRSADRIR